jgi:hypothetical protein
MTEGDYASLSSGAASAGSPPYPVRPGGLLSLSAAVPTNLTDTESWAR